MDAAVMQLLQVLVISQLSNKQSSNYNDKHM